MRRSCAVRVRITAEMVMHHRRVQVVALERAADDASRRRAGSRHRRPRPRPGPSRPGRAGPRSRNRRAAGTSAGAWRGTKRPSGPTEKLSESLQASAVLPLSRDLRAPGRRGRAAASAARSASRGRIPAPRGRPGSGRRLAAEHAGQPPAVVGVLPPPAAVGEDHEAPPQHVEQRARPRFGRKLIGVAK